MSDQDNIFQAALEKASSDQDKKTTQNVDYNAVFADKLSSIKNEKGEAKYRSVEDALSALEVSQQHIAQIEKENSELREKTAQAKAVDDLLAKLDSRNNFSDDNQNTFSAEDIEHLVSQTLNKNEQVKAAKSNQSSVAQKLTEIYGEKAEDEYIRKAQELGMSVQAFDNLAASAPKAVLAYFSNAKNVDTRNNQGTVNTENLNKNSNELYKPSKSLMYGASTKDITEAWKQVSSQITDNY